VDALIVGLIWVLIAALILAVVCYVITRLVAQFFPGGGAYGWLVWAIGGLVLLLVIVRTIVPLIPGA
jgi:hypothetical protein